MYRKLIYLTCFALVLGLVGSNVASAATVWNPAANGITPPATGDWGVAANWTNGLPNAVEKAVFNVPDAAECVVTNAQSFNQFVQGDNGPGGVIRVVDGGSLTTGAVWSAVGYNNTAHMIVETGCSVTFGEHMWIGLQAGSVGTLDINGGTVNVAQMIGLGWNGGDGYVNVNDGGLLALSNIHGDGVTSIKQNSLLSINGTGSVTLPGDFVGVIDAYAAAGLIAGDGVLGAVQAVVADNVTTVTAVHPGASIPVGAGGDIAAANAIAQAGDTIEIAAGTYYLTSQIEIKNGVTYKGAGRGLTIIDGNNVTRAFIAWGDRFYNEDSNQPNNSGPKDWVLEGITIQNCVADTNDRFSYTSAAFNLKTNFATRDTNASGGLDPNEADAQVGGIRLPGADGTEPTADDDLHRFVHIDTDSSGAISMAELEAQLLLRQDEFGDKDCDGGAIVINNQAVGTIRNCEFLNNHTPAGGGDDGGAIKISGLSTITIESCLFNGNYACSANSVAIAGDDGDGGHIKVEGASASAITPGTTLIANRCVFKNGNASDDGGAIQSNAIGTVVRLDSCWFEGNTSWDNGNVCQFSNNAQNEATVTNCIFVKNITKAENSPDRLIETARNSKFINCTFVGNYQFDEDIIYNNANTADTDADGVNDESADTTQVINCLFANNTFGADASNDHILSSRNNNFTINAVNCLFFNNLEADGTTLMAITNRTHTGSVQADPLLDANYVPGAGSPAINAGVDPATVGVALTTDYNGNPRPQGAAYDIGAFEAP